MQKLHTLHGHVQLPKFELNKEQLTSYRASSSILVLTFSMKPGSYFMRMRSKFDVTTILSQRYSQGSWTELNCCEYSLRFLWRQHSLRIGIRRKYEPGFKHDLVLFVLRIIILWLFQHFCTSILYIASDRNSSPTYFLSNLFDTILSGITTLRTTLKLWYYYCFKAVIIMLTKRDLQ